MIRQVSSQSTLPLFGRRYDLTVTTQAGDEITVTSDTWEPEALRITFDIQLTGYEAMWTAFISIYNASSALIQTIINQGASVVLNGGYQVGNNYGTIFSGKVLRCTFEKENVTDYKLTMQCVTGMPELVNELLNFATGPFQTQSQLIAAMAQAASTPYTINIATPLKTGQLPRPQVFFGAPRHYIENIARDNNLSWTFADNTLHLGDISTGSSTPDLIYSTPIPLGSTMAPDATINYSIVGTPQQTNDGVALKVLLDSRPIIKFPCLCIKIDGTVIRQLPVALNAFPPVLSQDGLYALMSVRHIGDSRGNDWYTEMELCLTASQKATLLGDGSQTKDIRNMNLVPPVPYAN
jgi:hypothetical protein